MDGEKSRGKKNNNKLSNPYAMDHSKRSIELIRFPFQLGRRSIDIDFITIIFSSPWRTSFYMKRSKKGFGRAHTHTLKQTPQELLLRPVIFNPER
jgi:hypothetical protein